MLSILGKLLCSELGVHKYNVYFDCYTKNNKQNEVIFYDIYKELGGKDIYTLQKMLERLLSAVELSVRVSKQFIWVLLGTVITIISLVIINIPAYLTILGIVLVTVCFLYKSIVYLLNRYCYVDANITLLYKTALYHRILTYNIRRLAGKGEEC